MYESKMKKLFLISFFSVFLVTSLYAYSNVTKNITMTVGETYTINPQEDSGISFGKIWTLNSSSNHYDLESLGVNEYFVSHNNGKGAYVISDLEAFYITPIERTFVRQMTGYTSTMYIYSYKMIPRKAGTYIFWQFLNTDSKIYLITYNITVLEVTSVLLPSTVSLTLGQNYTFTPTIIQEGATCTLHWDSSDPSVATVSDAGTVSTHSCGSTTITCYTDNGLSASCNLVVNPVLVSGISVSPSEYTLCKGEELQLNATISPQNATTKQVTWSSSNRNIAEVDEDGHVTAYGEGTCTITARATDGSNVKGTCTLHVVKMNKLSLRDMSMPRGAQIRLPIYMDNEDDITAFQFELALPQGVTMKDYSLSSRKGDQSLSVSQKSNGKYLFTAFSSSNTPFSGHSGILLNLTINVADNMALGNYAMTLSAVEMTNPDETIYHQPDITANLSVEEALIGDVNCDGKVTVTDAVAIVNYILENPSSNFNEVAADVNGDGKISITDAVAIINIIHGQTGNANGTLFDETDTPQ